MALAAVAPGVPAVHSRQARAARISNTGLPASSSTRRMKWGSTRKPPLANTLKARAMVSGGTDTVPSASERLSGIEAGSKPKRVM